MTADGGLLGQRGLLLYVGGLGVGARGRRSVGACCGARSGVGGLAELLTRCEELFGWQTAFGFLEIEK